METLTPNNTALLVVDMQGTEKMKFHTHDWNRIVHSIQSLMGIARKVRMPIIHIFYSTDLQGHVGPFQYDSKKDPFEFETRGGGTLSLWYYEHIVRDCFPKIGEWMYGKSNKNAFEEGDFLSAMDARQNGELQNLIVSGVMLGDCVMKTAKGAQEFGYRSIVIPEATGMTKGGERGWLEENGHEVHIGSMSEIVKQIGKTRERITEMLV